ncbi:TPA: hypothetical protein MEZ67_000786 [Klebsiella pneumoniae]|nr:hypothetical protein [Klebsiella pneumoniae]
MNNTLSDSQLEAMIKSAVNSSGPLPPDEKFSQLVSALRELQERRKAALDSEPVAWIAQNKNTGEVEIDEPFAKATNPKHWTDSFPVYRHAQPVPVVPEEITSASAPEVFEIAAEAERLGLRGTYASYVVGWNACRSAMLAAAPQEVKSES